MAAQKYDAESLIADLETILKADLNDKLSEITAEKGDGLELKSVDSNAYIFQTQNDTIANYDPFIYFEISEVETLGIGPATSEKIFVTIVILVVDSGQDLSIGKRLIRYSRALKEVIEANWDKIPHTLKMSVKSLSPSPFRYAFANSADTYRAVGVQVEANIG